VAVGAEIGKATYQVADSGRPGREIFEASEAIEKTPDSSQPQGGEVNDWTEASGDGKVQVALTAAVAEGGMPYCLGLTMTEVLEKAARADLPIKMVGSGIAIRQSPPPGTLMTPGRQAMVVFAAPSQTLKVEEAGEGLPERGGSAVPKL